MKIYDKRNATKIIEPPFGEDGTPAVLHLGRSYITLMHGAFGKGTKGLIEVDYTDGDVALDIAASIRAVVTHEDQLDGMMLELYQEFTRPTHSEYRADALVKIDMQHADFMKRLTGDATTEERDTWPAKVAASKFIAVATDAQITTQVALVVSDDAAAIDDLETLVMDVGEDIGDLRNVANVVLTKSRAYKRLIGLASKLRREGKAAITQATDDAQPIETVGATLDAIEVGLTTQVSLAIEQWQGAG